MIIKLSLLRVFCLFLLLNTRAFAAYTLVYTGNLNGELEPCGCTLEGDFGGIKRQVTAIDRLRRQDPDLLLVSSGGLLVSDIPSDRIRSDYILRGMKLLGYDAIGVQKRDLAYGTEFLAHRGLPMLLGSVQESPAFSTQRTVQRETDSGSAQRFSLFHWSELPAEFKLQAADVGSGRADAKVAALTRFAADLAREKGEGAITVVTTNLRPNEAVKVLPLKDIDILIIPTRRDQFAPLQRVGDTLLLQPGARGMRIGVLRFDIEQTGGESRIVDPEQEIVPLPNTVPDSPRTSQWYADYEAALKADYERQVALRERLIRGESSFAGADKCKTCHLPEFEQWQTTDHSRAYTDLEDVGKNFDPNCVGCHSVGFTVPGGFLNQELTPHLSGVQCESCHGAGRAHVQSNGTLPTGNKGWEQRRMCLQCHIGGHSPSFDLQTYSPRVRHRRADSNGPDPQRQSPKTEE